MGSASVEVLKKCGRGNWKCEYRESLTAKEGTFYDDPGNYTENNQCSWVIDATALAPKSSNSSTGLAQKIRLHLGHFATECSWDHLYIYDGDSVFAPLRVVYSGLVVSGGYRSTVVPEIELSSPYALVHFYSDAAYNLTGFDIHYRVGGCRGGSNATGGWEECSGRGRCVENVCECEQEYGGEACERLNCPHHCSNNGHCHPRLHTCVCNRLFTGSDCSQSVLDVHWTAARFRVTSDDALHRSRRDLHPLRVQSAPEGGLFPSPGSGPVDALPSPASGSDSVLSSRRPRTSYSQPATLKVGNFIVNTEDNPHEVSYIGNEEASFREHMNSVGSSPRLASDFSYAEDVPWESEFSIKYGYNFAPHPYGDEAFNPRDFGVVLVEDKMHPFRAGDYVGSRVELAQGNEQYRVPSAGIRSRALEEFSVLFGDFVPTSGRAPAWAGGSSADSDFDAWLGSSRQKFTPIIRDGNHPYLRDNTLGERDSNFPHEDHVSETDEMDGGRELQVSRSSVRPPLHITWYWWYPMWRVGQPGLVSPHHRSTTASSPGAQHLPVPQTRRVVHVTKAPASPTSNEFTQKVDKEQSTFDITNPFGMQSSKHLDNKGITSTNDVENTAFGNYPAIENRNLDNITVDAASQTTGRISSYVENSSLTSANPFSISDKQDKKRNKLSEDDDGRSGRHRRRARDDSDDDVESDEDGELHHPLLERASCTAVVFDDVIYVAGGFSFEPLPFLVRYNTSDGTVEAVVPKGNREPSARHGHIAVNHNGTLMIFGGQLRDGSVTSQLWRFVPSSLKWSLLGGRRSASRPLSHDGGRKSNGGRRGVRRSDEYVQQPVAYLPVDIADSGDFDDEVFPDKDENLRKSSTVERNAGKSVGDFVSYLRKKYPDLYEAQFQGKSSVVNKTTKATHGHIFSDKLLYSSTDITSTTLKDTTELATAHDGLPDAEYKPSSAEGNYFPWDSDRELDLGVSKTNKSVGLGKTMGFQTPNDELTDSKQNWGKLYSSGGSSNLRNRWFGRDRDGRLLSRRSGRKLHRKSRTVGSYKPPDEFDDRRSRASLREDRLESSVLDSKRSLKSRVRRKAQTGAGVSVSDRGDADQEEDDAEKVHLPIEDTSLFDDDEEEDDHSPGSLLFADSPNSIASNLNPADAGGFGGECRRRRGRGGLCAPIAVVGAGAVIIPGSGEEKEDVMLIIFGYSPIYGFLNTVQEYHFGSNSWRLVQCGGAVVQGRYGHSVVWDSVGRVVLVHGGLVAAASTSSVVPHMLAYNHATATWFVLPSSPRSVYLHSGAQLAPGAVVYYGGNSHNDTSVSHSARCYTHATLLYDTLCGVWTQHLPQPLDIGVDTARYGHAMVVLSDVPRTSVLRDGSRRTAGTVGDVTAEESVQGRGVQSSLGVVLSGFSGRMQDSALLLHSGRCVLHSNPSDCLNKYPAVKCVWNTMLSQCELYDPVKDVSSYILCPHDLTKDGTPRSTGTSSPSTAAVATRLPAFARHYNLNSSAAQCRTINNCVTCLHSSLGCVWCGSSGCKHQCRSPVVKTVESASECPVGSDLPHRCRALISCQHCHNFHGNGAQQSCVWLQNNQCVYNNNTQTPSGPPTDVMEGGGAADVVSDDSDSKEGAEEGITTSPVPTAVSVPSSTDPVNSGVSSKFRPCHMPPCHLSTSCENCTRGQCMWCHNEQRCVDNNSYLVSFPYGSCREWSTSISLCRNATRGSDPCLLHRSCVSCQSSIECGWCDDGSGTGTGSCVTGGITGPRHHVTGDLLPPACPANSWYFTSCPPCNCNGHSHCKGSSVGDASSSRTGITNQLPSSSSSVTSGLHRPEEEFECVRPCANNTEGRHCQHCKQTYFGSAINGGHCTPCFCHEHGTLCDRSTGRCFCSTKGVTGEHCDKCDEQNNYFGDPRNGSCFYDLQIDYQFTFNLSKAEDRHVRQINFFNVPTKANVDTDFDISSSKPARIKISAKETGGHEVWVVRNFTGTRIQRRFSHTDYSFGSADNNTTFHVYVYNFTPPVEIVVSFSQYLKLNLLGFFYIFLLCFLCLLVVAAVLWKIKQKYDIYTRRRRLMVEMEAMAARPFKPVLLELHQHLGGEDEAGGEEEHLQLHHLRHANGEAVTGRNKTRSAPSSPVCPPTSAAAAAAVASPIALEMCSDNKAAVLSLLVQLPTGGTRYLPRLHPGGLAIASTLVSLGNQRSNMAATMSSGSTSNSDPLSAVGGGAGTKTVTAHQKSSALRRGSRNIAASSSAQTASLSLQARGKQTRHAPTPAAAAAAAAGHPEDAAGAVNSYPRANINSVSSSAQTLPMQERVKQGRRSVTASCAEEDAAICKASCANNYDSVVVANTYANSDGNDCADGDGDLGRHSISGNDPHDNNSLSRRNKSSQGLSGDQSVLTIANSNAFSNGEVAGSAAASSAIRPKSRKTNELRDSSYDDRDRSDHSAPYTDSASTEALKGSSSSSPSSPQTSSSHMTSPAEECPKGNAVDNTSLLSEGKACKSYSKSSQSSSIFPSAPVRQQNSSHANQNGVAPTPESSSGYVPSKVQSSNSPSLGTSMPHTSLTTSVDLSNSRVSTHPSSVSVNSSQLATCI
ncbi:CUB domain [Trinorchestia longiramus]|nr:CUB domain [Trinorchestia longiramus]